MKGIRLVLAIVSVIGISACSEPYDYSGAYTLKNGDDCDDAGEGDNQLVTILPVDPDSGLYTAKLNAQMSGGGLFPLKSEVAAVRDNGDIEFQFFKEGKVGFLSTKPDIDMALRFSSKDENHILLTSWKVKVSQPKITSFNGDFDFVNDPEFELMGKTNKNTLYNLKGKQGLCLMRD